MLVWYDNGHEELTTWSELWCWMWCAVAHAVHLQLHGACRCGCKKRECNYCTSECWWAA